MARKNKIGPLLLGSRDKIHRSSGSRFCASAALCIHKSRWACWLRTQVKSFCTGLANPPPAGPYKLLHPTPFSLPVSFFTHIPSISVLHIKPQTLLP